MSQLPANLTTVEVRAKAVGSDGNPVTPGSILFTPKPLRMVNAAALTIVVGRGVTLTLDEDGAGAVQLMATDDPDLVPFEWTYVVSEAFPGGTTYEIEVPIAEAAEGIDLAMVAPAPGSTGTGGIEVTTGLLQTYTDAAAASALTAEEAGAAALAAETAAEESATAADASETAALAAQAAAAGSASAAAASATTAQQSVLTGNGIPEGVVTAPVGTRYTDLSATAGAIQWVKATGTGNTGWRVTYGDTGQRRNDPAASWFINSATPGADADAGTRFRRVGSRVQLQLCVTTPAGWVNGTKFLAIPSGFRPTGVRYLHAGYVNTYAVTVSTDTTGLEFWSGVISNARYLYTWFTDDPWPAALPGIAI